MKGLVSTTKKCVNVRITFQNHDDLIFYIKEISHYKFVLPKQTKNKPSLFIFLENHN
jgi:hypothetical protein